ncbi:MAG: NAD-dependent epimerase/dehydratase family protein [Alphaproteobacteria bacterium]|nr:NAD-dependent epimerase/dehydratase family protein [Alphaproteobacteria bacterium]
MQIDSSSSFLITGGTGLVGRALGKILAAEGFTNVACVGSRDYDLRDGNAVVHMFADIHPEYVFHLAARVHGLGGNTKYKSDIIYENVMINTHVVEQARRAGVKKIVAMGSGCVYPELKGQEELKESQIWIGSPHPSEDSYAHAKRLMLAQLIAAREQYGLVSAFAISGNLYGPHDNFNADDGHVIPSLVAKFHAAEQSGTSVKVWGSGVAIRDFSHCNDAAAGLLCLMRRCEGPINLGSGFLHPISDIVKALEDATAHKVKVEWDASKPDGQLRRYYNLDQLAQAGFKAKISLAEGVRETYEWYKANAALARR